MTKFEQVGVDLQYDAMSVRDAVTSFRYSCKVCCRRGMRIDCDRCAIRATHDMTVAYFASDGREPAEVSPFSEKGFSERRVSS